jgi:hypothetical protein
LPIVFCVKTHLIPRSCIAISILFTRISFPDASLSCIIVHLNEHIRTGDLCREQFKVFLRYFLRIQCNMIDLILF